MPYKPETIAAAEALSTADLVQYLSRELEKVSQAIAPIEQGRIILAYTEPPKKRTGMLVYADGTGWNPGSGAGLYVYDGSGWVFISHPETLTTAFTPTIKFGGAAVGITYATQLGSYTINGKQAHITCRVTLTNKGASVGVATLEGIAVANSGILAAASVGWEQGFNAQPVGGYWTGNILQLLKIAGGASAAMTDADFTNGADIIISATANL